MTETFSLNYNNVQLYGGFVGTETVRSQRDWHANVTVLSGDIDGNDTTNTDGVVTDADNISGNNTHHVLYLDGVTNEPITSTTTIDGFTITAGQANGGSEWNDGGGLYCDGHEGAWYNPHICSPILTNIIFSGNSAEDDGGAMFNYAYHDGYSSPTLTNVTFSGNWADEGGAMYNDGHFGGESNPTLTNVIFRNNSAGHGWTSDHGGAMFNNGDQGTSNPMLINVLFSHNSADGDGGALYCTGMHGRCNPTLINVTFSDNSAGDDGGAIAHGGYPDPNNANLTLSNVILWGNTADDGGDQIMVAYAILTIGHSDVQGGLSGSGVYYVESTLVDLGGNINVNPRDGSLRCDRREIFVI
jgi:predicted outer membrane repeat protein